jgi:hypothetical protein
VACVAVQRIQILAVIGEIANSCRNGQRSNLLNDLAQESVGVGNTVIVSIYNALIRHVR